LICSLLSSAQEAEAAGDGVIPPPVLAKMTKVGSIIPDKIPTSRHFILGTQPAIFRTTIVQYATSVFPPRCFRTATARQFTEKIYKKGMHHEETCSCRTCINAAFHGVFCRRIAGEGQKSDGCKNNDPALAWSAAGGASPLGRSYKTILDTYLCNV